MDTSRKTCEVCNGKHPRDLHCLKVTSQKNPQESQANENDTAGQQKSTHSTLANSVNMGSHLISMKSVVPVRIRHEGTVNW